MDEKCPHWKPVQRKSDRTKPNENYPNSCLGCSFLHIDPHEGYYCSNPSAGMKEVSFPDFKQDWVKEYLEKNPHVTIEPYDEDDGELKLFLNLWGYP